MVNFFVSVPLTFLGMDKTEAFGQDVYKAPAQWKRNQCDQSIIWEEWAAAVKEMMSRKKNES